MPKPTRIVPRERPMGGWVASFMVIFFGAGACAMIAISGATHQEQMVSIILLGFGMLAIVVVTFRDAVSVYNYEAPPRVPPPRRRHHEAPPPNEQTDHSETPAGWHDPHGEGDSGATTAADRAAAAAGRVLSRTNERWDRRDPNFTPRPWGADYDYEPDPYDEDSAWRAGEGR